MTHYQNLHSVYMVLDDRVVEITHINGYNMTVGDHRLISNETAPIFPVTPCSRDIFYSHYLHWQRVQSRVLRDIENKLQETK